MKFVETHCHLDDDAFESDLPSVLDTARAAGIGHFVNIGYEPDSWKRSLLLAESHPEISYVLGMHPNSAELWTEQTKIELSELLKTVRPVGIGETGLDYFRERADHDAQRRAFRDQLMLAREFRLPVVIHMRGEVETEIISLLSDFPDVRAILHSFDGSASLRDFLLERGDLIGVGGLMTRSGSGELREVLRTVPLDSIVLETDSPYLVPRGSKSRRNTPAAIPIVALALAELIECSIDDVARQTTANASRTFGIALAETAGGVR